MGKKHAAGKKALCLAVWILAGTILLSGCSRKMVPPETDYYEYVNGSLLRQTEIPPDSNGWSSFYQLSSQAYSTLDDIVKETVKNRAYYAKGSPQQQIADLYLTALDQKERDRAGLSHLTSYLDLIRNATDIHTYLDGLAVLNRDLGLSSLIGINGSIDTMDSATYVYEIGIADLGPGKEILNDKTQAENMKTYRTYIAALLMEAGYGKEEARTAAREIFRLQVDLSFAALPLKESSDPSKTYHPYTPAQLSELFDRADISAFLTRYGVEDGIKIIVPQPELERKVNEYLTEEHLPLLKAYSTFCLLNDMAPYTTSAIREASVAYQNQIRGITEKKSEEQLAGELVQSRLGFELGRLYAEQNFTEEDKLAVEQLVSDIRQAYEVRIAGLDWMSGETKAAAIRKLQAMSVKIGCPDVWPVANQTAVITSVKDGGVLVDNIVELLKAQKRFERGQMKRPVDRSVWYMTPQTVNAYYAPNMNEIVFPAAILQPPFYDRNGDDAANLGGIGMVIAHEISHAFDDTGAQYDERGNYDVWWTQEDYSRFHQRQQQVVAYYDGYEGFDGIMVNGRQTLGENIADLGAMNCVTGIVGNDQKKLQSLFEQFARIWASKYTDESMKLRLLTDVHAPAKVRVNAVSSSTDAFYTAYPQVKVNDPMYVAPEKRVKIW